MILVRPKRWSFKPPVGAQPNWGDTVTNGLLSLYLMNEGGGGGASLFDIAGGRTGTLGASITRVIGPFGYALNFPAATSVSLANPTVGLPSGASPRSMLVRCMTATIASGFAGAIGYGSNVSNQAFAILRNTADLIVGHAGAGNVITVSSYWVVNVWHTVVLTNDGTNLLVYSDGVQIGSLVKTPATVLNVAFIGNDQSTTELWNGQIDMAAIWSRALTAAEVQRLYLDPYILVQPMSPQRRLWLVPGAAPVGAVTEDHILAGSFGNQGDPTFPVMIGGPTYAG